MAKARSVTLSMRHLLATAVLGAAMVVGLAGTLYWLSLRFAADLKLPLVRELVLAVQQGEAERSREFLQQNLNAMAVKIGEMQAQLTRLDALGERLGTMAGIRPQEFRFSEAPGLGGAASTTMPAQNLTLSQFNEKVAMLSRQMEVRTDMLGVLEAQLFEQAVKKKAMPTMMPVNAPFNASGFGYRIDPFTGQKAMHEGIDFITDTGTPVVAAAGGVVQFAGFHPQYGNVVDIDMDLVVPDPNKTLREGAIAPWNTPAYTHELEELLALAPERSLPVDIPFRELTEEHRRLIHEGVPERKYGGLRGFFAWLEKRKYKMHLRVFAKAKLFSPETIRSPV